MSFKDFMDNVLSNNGTVAFSLYTEKRIPETHNEEENNCVKGITKAYIKCNNALSGLTKNEFKEYTYRERWWALYKLINPTYFIISEYYKSYRQLQHLTYFPKYDTEEIENVFPFKSMMELQLDAIKYTRVTYTAGTGVYKNPNKVLSLIEEELLDGTGITIYDSLLLAFNHMKDKFKPFTDDEIETTGKLPSRKEFVAMMEDIVMFIERMYLITRFMATDYKEYTNYLQKNQ